MNRFRMFTRWIAAAVVAAAVASAAGGRVAAAANQCEWDRIDRVVAIGDVHGAFDQFTEILRVAGIIGADGHWAGGTAHLVQLGDVLDRGTDSRKTMDLLRRLEREAQNAGGQVHALVGNHEVMRMLGDLRYTLPGEYEAFATANSESVRSDFLKSLNTPIGDREKMLGQTPLGQVEMRMAFGRDGEYGRWLRQLPVTVKINGFVFVHGGISPSVAGLGCEAINDRVRRDLTSDLDKTRSSPLVSLAARADGPLWYRGLAQEPDEFAPQVADILAKQHARAIVVGHTVTPENRIVTRFGGRVIEIDTAMQPAYVPHGRASALEIRGGAVTAVYVDRRDPVEVPGPATGSPDGKQ
jgi:calcineurin-like phosphoesterase family protein